MISEQKIAKKGKISPISSWLKTLEFGKLAAKPDQANLT